MSTTHHTPHHETLYEWLVMSFAFHLFFLGGASNGLRLFWSISPIDNMMIQAFTAFFFHYPLATYNWQHSNSIPSSSEGSKCNRETIYWFNPMIIDFSYIFFPSKPSKKLPLTIFWLGFVMYVKFLGEEGTYQNN